MYSCNWMLNVTAAGLYVIDPQLESTYTIVSALVKYYDTTAAEDSRCSVRLCPNTTVSAIISETLYNKDVVEVSNVPFTVSDGGRLFLHTTGPASLMLSVVSESARPAPGPLPVPFDFGNCTINNPPWWTKYVKAEDKYNSFKSIAYTFTTSLPAAATGLDTENTEIKYVWDNTKANHMAYVDTPSGAYADTYLITGDAWHTNGNWESGGAALGYHLFISLNSASTYAYICWLERVKVDPSFPVYRWRLHIVIKEIRDSTGDNVYSVASAPVIFERVVYSEERATSADDPATLHFVDDDGHIYNVGHYSN